MWEIYIDHILIQEKEIVLYNQYWKKLKKVKYLDASEHLLFDDDYDEHIPALDDQSLFSPVRYKRKKVIVKWNL